MTDHDVLYYLTPAYHRCRYQRHALEAQALDQADQLVLYGVINT